MNPALTKKDRSPYGSIPEKHLSEAFKLSHPALRLLIYLFSKGDEWEFRRKEIMRCCKLNSPSSFKRANKELVDTGWYANAKTEDGALIHYIGLDAVKKYTKKEEK